MAAARGKKEWRTKHNQDCRSAIPESNVPVTLFKQARHSGQLNLSNRNLLEVPEQVWRINIDVPEEGKDVSLDSQSGDRWWEQTDLTKLILASNQLKCIPSDIANLEALSVLDIHDNALESLPDEIGQLLHLWKLDLSHNKLISLPKSLAALTSLKVLLLSCNRLESVPDYFGNFINLQELDLTENLIVHLPESIGNLRNLKRLNLSNNQLTEFPSTSVYMTEMKDLCLRNNKLTLLPSGLQNMRSIEILDCGFNVITDAVQIDGFVNIKELYLNNNKIKQLNPECFKYLSVLVIFDVKDNSIQKIPEEISLLKSLERLDLRNNNISRLPFVMGTMNLLKSLLLDGNPLKGIRRDIMMKGTQNLLNYLRSRIETVEEKADYDLASSDKKRSEENDNCIISEQIDISNLAVTKKIDYSNKKVSVIPENIFVRDIAISAVDFSHNILTQIPLKVTLYASTLTDLKLRSNKLDSVPKELSLLQKLKYLDLGNNLLSSLPPEFTSWTSLTEIILSGNRFGMIPEFLYEIKSLEVLLFSSNQISSIDVASLLRLPHLGVLDLSNNSIAVVPPELGNVTNLKSLNIEGNPFRNPRHAVLLKGTAYILQYLRDRIPR